MCLLFIIGFDFAVIMYKINRIKNNVNCLYLIIVFSNIIDILKYLFLCVVFIMSIKFIIYVLFLVNLFL